MSDQIPENPAPQPQPHAGQPQRSRSSYRAYATYTLLGVTILVYLLQMYTESNGGVDLMIVYGAKINDAIIAGEYWRILTPVFLHASLWHILFNMYALFNIGPVVEQFYGRTRYLLLYFISGVAGNVVSFYLSPNPSVGASTALFGLVAAQGVFVFRNRQFFGGQARALLGNTLMIVVVNLVLGLSPGIDNWGHMGGMLGGLAFAWACGPRLEVNWMPGGGYKINDLSTMQTAWLVGGIETLVLIGLVILRTMKG
jgi:rhomboid protease GluP